MTHYGSTAGKYYSPAETEKKLLCEMSMMETFKSWGYREIIVPSLENVSPLSGAAHRHAYFVWDHKGTQMKLRSDWTASIGELILAHINEWSFPVRVCYRGSVFRVPEREIGAPGEFYQAGIELIGANGYIADGEVISLAVMALIRSGLKDFQIGLNDTRFLEALMTESGLNKESQNQLRAALFHRDFVAFRSLVNQMDIPDLFRRILLQLHELQGTETVFAQLKCMHPGSQCLMALDSLQHVLSNLKAAGLSRYIHMDLSLVRDMEYYSGIIFEGYAPGQGFPLLGGGRYSHFKGKNNEILSAAGFGIHIDRLMATLAHQGLSRQIEMIDYLVVAETQWYSAAILKATELRALGFKVSLGISLENQDVQTYASLSGHRTVLNFKEGTWCEILLKGMCSEGESA